MRKRSIARYLFICFFLMTSVLYGQPLFDGPRLHTSVNLGYIQHLQSQNLPLFTSVKKNEFRLIEQIKRALPLTRGVFEVEYKGRPYFAHVVFDERLLKTSLSKQIEILRYLEEEGVRGIPRIEHTLYIEEVGWAVLFVPMPSKDGRIEKKELLEVLIQGVAILGRLHQYGVYHKDFYEGNLWSTLQGNVILYDFDRSERPQTTEEKLAGFYFDMAHVLKMVHKLTVYSEKQRIKLNDMLDRFPSPHYRFNSRTYQNMEEVLHDLLILFGLFDEDTSIETKKLIQRLVQNGVRPAHIERTDKGYQISKNHLKPEGPFDPKWDWGV